MNLVNLASKKEVRRIKRSEIAATLKHVAQALNIPTKDLHKIGATGKFKTSGDIDVAVDTTKYEQSGLDSKLTAKFSSIPNDKSNESSYAIPIKGDEEKGFVKVDFTYTPNTDWAKFAYHSEGEGSRYKGAVRAVLLMGVASILNKQGLDHVEYNGDDLVISAGRSLEMGTGLNRIFKHRSGTDSTGKGFDRSVPIKQFKKMFPDIEIKGGQIIVDDPAKVVKVLFGSGVTPDSVRTGEQVLNLIKRKFDLATQEKIFNFAKKKAESMKGKMRLPKELMDNE